MVILLFFVYLTFLSFENSSVLHVYFQAYVVLGQFLVLKKNEELFVDWMKDCCSANAKQAKDCYTCLNEWTEAFIN